MTPSNIEQRLRGSRWVSNAIVVGDRRPYLVALLTLDADELPAFAREHGLTDDEVADSAALRDELQRGVDEVNADLARVEQVKAFAVLDRDLTLEDGDLTPSLKVKRGAVAEKHAAEIDALYDT